MVMTTSRPFAASATVSHQCAPASSTACALLFVRVYTLTSKPFFIRLSTIGPPITPTPINPIFIAKSSRFCIDLL